MARARPARTVSLALDRVESDPRFQIRLEPRPGELRASLEREGQLVPVLVQQRGDRYRLIDGFRRCEALRRLGAATVRAVAYDVSDEEALRLSFVANHARKTLVPADRWNAIRLMTRLGWTSAQIGHAVGMHPVAVRRIRGLFPHLAGVDRGIEEGWLRPAHLRALRSLVPRADWPRWLRVVREERLPAAKLRERVGADDRRRSPPYLREETAGVLVFRGFRFDPAKAIEDEVWRAIEQLDRGLDRLRSWLRDRRG